MTNEEEQKRKKILALENSIPELRDIVSRLDELSAGIRHGAIQDIDLDRINPMIEYLTEVHRERLLNLDILKPFSDGPIYSNGPSLSAGQSWREEQQRDRDRRGAIY